MYEPPPLRRALGLFDAVMIGLGAIIGAGIFVATGVAAESAGALLPLAILLAALPAVFNGLSAAANAVAFPKSGGGYFFARELLSPFFGFIAGWLFVFAALAADTAIALGFGAYVNSALPALPVRLVALGLVVLVAGVNYVGIGVVARINNLFTAIKVGVLALFIVVGLYLLATGGARPAPPSPVQPGGVVAGAAILFFAYPGYARVATLAEEVRDPRKTILRAVMLALAIAAVLYVLTTTVAVLLAGAEPLAGSAAPLAVAAGATGVGWLPAILAAGGVIATSSVFLIDITALSRVVLAMARNGDLPSYFSQINPRFSSPGRAVVAAGAAIGILVLIAELSALIAASSFALLFYYVFVNASALRLRPADRPFPALIPVLGLVSCLGLASFLPLPAIVLGLLVAGIGAAAYGVRILANRSRLW